MYWNKLYVKSPSELKAWPGAGASSLVHIETSSRFRSELQQKMALSRGIRWLGQVVLNGFMQHNASQPARRSCRSNRTIVSSEAFKRIDWLTGAGVCDRLHYGKNASRYIKDTWSMIIYCLRKIDFQKGSSAPKKRETSERLLRVGRVVYPPRKFRCSCRGCEYETQKKVLLAMHAIFEHGKDKSGINAKGSRKNG